jgi:60 kDa SS-A/Ro ribonucleoprotein
MPPPMGAERKKDRNMTYNYSKQFNNKKTSQAEFVPGMKNQVRNSDGSAVFKVSPMDQLDRFLILGSESPTYYASAKKATKANARSIEKLIASNGLDVVNRVVEISVEGRAPKNDPAIFVLAMCAKLGNDVTRKAAYAALPKVCRIGTHLFQFAEAAEAFGGWGRGMRNAVANWYNSKSPEKLQYQVIKYKQREGWSHRDLLRLAHVKPVDELHGEIYKYVTTGQSTSVFDDESENALWTIWACEQAKVAETVGQVVKLINDYNLPREAIPTAFLNHPKVWDALLQKMPMTAMIRNLGKMTNVGIVGSMSVGERLIVEKLADEAVLAKARIHPLSVLNAMHVYKQGQGFRGSLSWDPSQRIVDALDDAFHATFKYVEPSNKRTLLALDVSGSMGFSNISGMPGITPRVGSAAMAMVTARVEKSHDIVGFTSPNQSWGSTGMSKLDISARQRLDDVLRVVDAAPMGGTDCSLPMVWAKKNKVPVDTFVIYTDSETNARHVTNVHPFQALKEYRQATGIPAKLVVVGMVSNGFTVADPNDNGMLDVVGFDSAAPSIISNFSKG